MEGQQEGAPDIELLDPTPDIHHLFKHYNAKYFEGKLSSVKLRWDTNMKLKSGEFIHRGKRNCEITLSEPLLKFRSRADLLNTLLHEMIHAYLFLTNAKDPDGHGPEFLRMASYINKMEKTNIQQYHNFKAEVEFYSQQWKCNKCSATTKGTPKKCACGGAFVKVPNGSGAKSSTAKPGVGKSMTMDKFVVTKKKAEPPTAQPPAKRQRLSLHKEKGEEPQSQEQNQGGTKRRTLSEAMEEAFLVGSDGDSIFFVGDFPIFPCPLPLPSEKESPFFMHSDDDMIVPKPLPSLHDSKKKDTAPESRPSEKREEIMIEDISIIEADNENLSSMSEATPASLSEPEDSSTGTNKSQDEELVAKAVMPPPAVRSNPMAPSHAQPPSSAKGTPALPTKPKPPVQQQPSPQPQQLHQPQPSPPPKPSTPPKPSVPPPVARKPSPSLQPPPRPVTKLPTTTTTTHAEPPKPSRVVAQPRTAPPPPTRTPAPSSKAPTAPITLPNSGKAMKYPPPVVIPRRTPAPKPQPSQQPQKQQQQLQQTLPPAKPVPQFHRPTADTKKEEKTTPDTSAHEGTEEGTSKETTTCFMCGSVVPGDSSSVVFNQHVDECLSRNFINAENM